MHKDSDTNDTRVIITDQSDIITYQQYCNPNLVVVSFTDTNELSSMIKKYQARVAWTIEDCNQSSIAGIFLPKQSNLTMFMLCHAEFYHYKKDWWESAAIDHAKELAREIEQYKENLADAYDRLLILEATGPIEYDHYMQSRPRSSKLRTLLSKIRGVKIPVLGSP
jgi:hypothetical protein